MPLDKVKLKNKLIQIFSQPDTDSNVEQVAEQIADAIDEYVKRGKDCLYKWINSTFGRWASNRNV